MKLSRFNWIILALSAAMSVFGFWSFIATLSAIPESMLTASGTIASAEAHSRKGRISVIRFKVSPTEQEFSYPDILDNAEEVWDKIHRNAAVEVHYTNPKEPTLWGLKLAGETLITPGGAYAARRENGYWGLGVGVAFLCSCLYMLFVEGRRGKRWLARQGRPLSGSWHGVPGVRSMRGSALLTSLVLAFPCIAADKELADKLVTVIGYRDVSERVTQICLAEARKTDVADELKQRPGLFGDIGPDSPVWEETKQAWIGLVESNCYYTDQSKAMRVLSREYASGMTNSEIESVLAFYETPVGQKLRDVGIAAAIAATQESSDPAALDKAYEQYLRKLENLMHRHQQQVVGQTTQGTR